MLPVRLPTFLIIGAPKAGTTSLHEYLAAHPQIAMTSNKEPMCFERANWEQAIESYEELFTEDAPIRGESSTAYSSFPWVPEIPDRVRATIPDAKLIYLVRDPIERMRSHYAQNVWDRLPVRPFDELMDDLEHPMNMPVWCSRYATQLERWTDRFGADRVLVLDQHDLLRAREATLARVLAFLGADPGFSSPAWQAEHNRTDVRREPRRGPLGRWLTRAVPKPELTPVQRERLVALLAPEMERFRAMTGLPFDGWSV